MNTKEKHQTKYAFAAFLAVLVFVIMYKYCLNVLQTDGLADLKDHTKLAESIYLDRFWGAWLQRPYIFWHLCVKGFIKFFSFPTVHASACTCACFAAFNYYVSLWVIERVSAKVTNKDTFIMSSVVSVMLSFVAAFYIPWINSYQYEGQFSINPIFNPTHMAVKPFGLLAFAVAIDLILRYKGKETIFFTSGKAQKWLYVIFAVFLFLSTLTKPTFLYMLLPTGVIYVLIELVISLIHKDGSWKKTWNFMWKLACACIPSLIYLLLEYSAFYFWGGTNADAKVTVYPFLTAWHLYSADVPSSIIMGMCFPLWMVVTNLKYFAKSVEGRLSFLGYCVGTLEFSFFVETGDKLGHLNFSWPMMSGMLLLWVIAGSRLVQLTFSEDNRLINRIIVSVGWILLSVHLFSGLYYINPYNYII